MAFERPLKIRNVIESIDRREYYLPAIQREFVWDAEQMERLFDSLMRDYPIGSFLFWKVRKEQSLAYQFYEFIRDFHVRDRTHNPKANISGENDLMAVLDGQQRLTALYIGLKGSYAYKMPWMHWANDSAFPKRKLSLNLLNKSVNTDMEYDFRFLTAEESQVRDDDHYWFPVGKILDLREEYEVNKYLIENELFSQSKEKAQFANKALFKWHSVIHKDDIINYYLEHDQNLDKVLNIFIRVNSGGTQLSYSDLLLSIATAQWEEKDAREVITKFVDQLNNIGEGFDLNKDFVLKACLVLNNFPNIAFKVDNFNRQNMLDIERNWERVSEALVQAFSLVSAYGYNRHTLASNYAVIPISYYLLTKSLPHNFVQSSAYKNDRKQIKEWLVRSLLRRAFSGQPDNVLRPIRQIISEDPPAFPTDKIIERFKGHSKTIGFADDDIENLFIYKYGQNYTFSTLAMLYPSLDFRNRFHIDHIFPRSSFTRKRLISRGIEESKIEFYMENFNCLANLQLIEGLPNLEKSDKEFSDWVDENYPNEHERKDYMRKHYIPDVNLGLDDFDNFITERKKLMTQAFRAILNVSPHPEGLISPLEP